MERYRFPLEMALCAAACTIAALILNQSAVEPEADGAPVPFRSGATKPVHPDVLAGRRLAGEWEIHWQGGKGLATFRPRGGFECNWCGQKWIGNWEVSDNVLTVQEAIEPQTPGVLPNWYTWKATLDPDGRGGRLPSGGIFRLAPVKK